MRIFDKPTDWQGEHAPCPIPRLIQDPPSASLTLNSSFWYRCVAQLLELLCMLDLRAGRMCEGSRHPRTGLEPVGVGAQKNMEDPFPALPFWDTFPSLAGTEGS